MDLSDNEIVKLEGFPPLKRLSTLLAHNNRVARLGAGLGGALRAVFGSFTVLCEGFHMPPF